ncbi:MAG: bacterial Ig-like domain-containing protein, partial [Clostridia bacterium]|nr:bacterial Ig-like domain-containing protein [Clostridia bacterium]
QFGAVYVDTINNEYTGGGALKPEDYENAEEAENGEEAPGRDTLDYRTLNQSLIKDFELIGPNEEVYLSPGYGVGFIVESSKKPTTVQLEMKVPSLNKKTSSLSVYTYGQKDIGTISITSATEMFYDITDSVKFTQVGGKYRAVVVLENGISAQDLSEIVSITNLKLTYDEDVIALDANDESVFSLDSFDEDNTAVVALKANWNLYENVFGEVYTHRVAATPDYTISESTVESAVFSGTTATATVKTSQFVNGLVIKDPDGNEVKPESITSVIDESKLYTEEYKEAKTWTVKFKVNGTTGVKNYTVESANGEGSVSDVTIVVLTRSVSSISVVSKPNKTTYKVGETFNDEGMTIRVKYSDGTEKVTGSGFSTENVKFTKTGTQKVKVNYGGVETTLNVKVRYSAVQVIATIFGFGWLFKR